VSRPLSLNKRRSPSELRNLLEVRVRRQAHSYNTDARREALEEIRDLANAALAQIDDMENAR
jgi:hypothetical protein